MEQIHQQQQYLQEMLQLRIRVIAMANSRTMLVSQDGIDLSSWQDQLTKGEASNVDAFLPTQKHLTSAIVFL